LRSAASPQWHKLNARFHRLNAICVKTHFPVLSCLLDGLKGARRQGEIVLFVVLTIVHGHTLVLHATHVAAQLVLALGVLDQLRLHGEAPHLLQGGALQLYLVQDLHADFHELVIMKLWRKEILELVNIVSNNSIIELNFFSFMNITNISGTSYLLHLNVSLTRC